MKENTLSYTTRIGKTTFIVNVKQSESAKKPLNTVFQEICRHEMFKKGNDIAVHFHDGY